MEIWLDTCDSQKIIAACRLGIISGITTNPSILARSNENHEKVIERLLDIQDGPVAVQVTADTADEMIKQAQDFQSISERIIVKIPVIQEGIIAMKALVEEGISVMATTLFQLGQALLAALAGADYVAPYVSRIFEEGIEAYADLEMMLKVYKKYQFKTKIIAAALRTSDQIIRCAAMGIPAMTLKSELFSEFTANNHATLNSLTAFKKEWAEGQSI